MNIYKGYGEESIDRRTLRRLAGKAVFKRGEQYAGWGLVLDWSENEAAAEFLVAGSRIYRTGLRSESEQILFYCDCPMGQAGKFCKHVVAAGLQRINQGKADKQFKFIDMWLEQAINSLGRGEQDPFGRMWRDRVIERLDGLLDEGRARKMLDLTERGLGHLALARRACVEDKATDADWRLYAKELCERQIIACRIAGLKARAVAGRLLRRQLQEAAEGCDAGWLNDILKPGYDEWLGEPWRAAYRRLVEQKLIGLDRDLTPAERRQRGWLLSLGREQQFAAETGDGNFPADRKEPTVSTVRPKPGTPGRKKHRHWSRIDSDDSELVDTLLNHGKVEEAWLAAQSGGCSDELWLKLAALRIRLHPEDTLVVYRRLVEKNLKQKNLYAYAESERLLRRARRLMKRLGREEEFAPYLEGLWKTYGRQRNLKAVFERLMK